MFCFHRRRIRLHRCRRSSPSYHHTANSWECTLRWRTCSHRRLSTAMTDESLLWVVLRLTCETRKYIVPIHFIFLISHFLISTQNIWHHSKYGRNVEPACAKMITEANSQSIDQPNNQLTKPHKINQSINLSNNQTKPNQSIMRQNKNGAKNVNPKIM